MLTRRHARSALDRPRLVSIPVPRPSRLARRAVLAVVGVALVWTALHLAWALGGVIGGVW